MAQSASSSDNVLISIALTGFWFFLFVLSVIYEMVVHSQEAGRIIHFPGCWVDKLREEAMAELQFRGVKKEDAFLSHGDVLLAFWCKTTIAAQRLRSSRPVLIMNLMNIRGILEELPNPGATAYVRNATLASVTQTNVAELERMSVSELASRIRQDLEQQRQPAQVRAMVAWASNCLERGARAPLWGSWNQIILAWSNWNRAWFYDIDFSSAIVLSARDSGNRTMMLGQPSYMTVGGQAEKMSLRNGDPLIGKDANGDWWVNWSMRAEAWSNVEKALEEML